MKGTCKENRVVRKLGGSGTPEGRRRAQMVVVHKGTCCRQGSEVGLGSWRSQRVLEVREMRRQNRVICWVSSYL